MNYIENDDTTSTSDSGREKGSIKDRVISFFYRKRFKVKLEKQNIEQTKLLSMVILSIVKKKRIIIAN